MYQVGGKIVGEADLVSSALSLHPQCTSNCGFIWYGAFIGGQYRGTFLVPVPSILWKKVPVPQCRYFCFSIFGGTRYYCKIFCNKKIITKKVKSAQLHLYTFHSNCLKDLFLEYNAANPSSTAIKRFFSQEKIF